MRGSRNNLLTLQYSGCLLWACFSIQAERPEQSLMKLRPPNARHPRDYCHIFKKTGKVRSLGSQPMSKRCSRAVWMQDRAGSKDLKRPWRWKLPKLPITHGDDRNSGSQRRGMSVSGKRKGTPHCWFGFLTISFQISQTPYKPSSKNILSKRVLKASSSKVSTPPRLPQEKFYRKGLSNTAQLWSTARSGPTTTSPGHAAQVQRRTIWFKVYVYTTYYGGDWRMAFKFLKLR